MSVNAQREGVKKMESGSSQWCPVPGQEAVAQTGAQEVLCEQQAALLCWAGDRALAQAVQRGCGVSSFLRRRQTFSSHLDVALGTLLGVSLLKQGLGQGPPEGLASLTSLWVCPKP